MQRTLFKGVGSLLAGAVLASLLVAAGAAPPTADDVIAHWVTARGGRARIQNVRSARLFGRIAVGADAGGPLLVLIARPPRIRTQFTLGGHTLVQGYDGHVAWLSDGGAVQALSADQTKNVAAGADLDGPLLDHRAKGNRVTLAGTDTADGRPAYHLSVTLASGLHDDYYIDSATWMQVKWRGTRFENGAPVVNESWFHDYRPVGGVMFAYRIDSRTVGRAGGQVIVLDSVQLNVPVTTADFAMPTGGTP